MAKTNNPQELKAIENTYSYIRNNDYGLEFGDALLSKMLKNCSCGEIDTRTSIFATMPIHVFIQQCLINYYHNMWDILKKCESELEKYFLFSLMTLCINNGFEIKIDDLVFNALNTLAVSTMQIDVNHKIINKFRVDFMLTASTPEHIGVCFVEIDGHEFHEKTKQQATKDKSR